MKRPSIDEATIRRHASEQSYYRGVEYYEGGAVDAMVWRDQTLWAEIYGSQHLPYNIRVTFTASGITDADCDCPYDWGGWCKHIVAVLLTYLRKPGLVEERQPLQALLADLDRDQLEELLLEIAARDVTLVDRIEAKLATIRPTASPAGPQPAQPTVDAKPVRRQVRSILRSLDRMPHSEAYWHVGGVVDGVRETLTPVWDLIRAGDGRNALILLEAITEEYVDNWLYLDDSDGSVGVFFDELGEIWTEACLVADLSTAEREAWAEKLRAWHEEVDDYGIDGGFAAAEAAVRQGWDYPPLQRVLQGKITELGAWDEEAPWFADHLARARLRVLERQERYTEYLNLAQAEGQLGLYVVMLAKVGRENEAVEEGIKILHHPEQFLNLAQTLYERGNVDAALTVAEHGLSLEGRKRALASWLRDQAATAGASDLALKAAVVVFREELSLASYLEVEKLAGGQWDELRQELLDRLRRRRSLYSGGPTEIFLYEGLLDDAIAAVEKGGGRYQLLERVMEAAMEHRPDWVIQTAQEQAARIIESGKSKHYHHAVDWVRKAREAYLAAGRASDWQAYLTDIRERHGRKYKLMGLLEGL